MWDNSDPSFSSLVVFDEVDVYGKNNESIKYLYWYGRHKGLDIIAISRRFYELPVVVRSQTDRFYCFQVTEWNDLREIRYWIGSNYAEKIFHLDKFQYIIIDQ